MVCWSLYAHASDILPNGCISGPPHNLTGPHDPPAGYGYLVEPFISRDGNVCWDFRVKWAFLSCLLGLQVLTVLWLVMIIKVAVRVVKGGSADDVRSDDEAGGEEAEEEEEVEEEGGAEKDVYAEEVGVDEIDLRGWERRSGVRKRTGASGVSLSGHHSDRKELLGRIGCEKQVD